MNVRLVTQVGRYPVVPPTLEAPLKKILLPAILACALIAGALAPSGSSAATSSTITPAHPSFSYDAGPYSQVNVGGLLLGSCISDELVGTLPSPADTTAATVAPKGCDVRNFTVSLPSGYYDSLRKRGKIGVVQVSLTWANHEDDFDLALLNSDNDPIATSGFGNSTFERIDYTELPSGTYSIQVSLFRAVNASFHADVRLLAMTPSPTVASTGGATGATFGNGVPVALERSSGEPNMEIAPNGDIYTDIPLGAGTNSILYKSTDNGQTFKPLSPLSPNNNQLQNNAAGGGDSGLAIDPAGRMCFSELNTLLSLGIGCSADGGKTWTPSDPIIVDPTTPLVDRQWQTATAQGEQFISAQFGIVSAGPSSPGIRVFKEVASSGQFEQVGAVDTGAAMKSYNMASDRSDTDADGGTVMQAYLRSNTGRDAAAKPHELMVWRSTDGGKTITSYKVADLPTTPGNNFASVATDRQGNIYVAWTEQGTWDVFYAVAPKSSPGKFSKAFRVNAEPDARTAIQPTIKVGDRGRVFIGYYAAPQIGNPDRLTDGVWNAYLSVSTNGACMLERAPCKRPTFTQTRVTDHPVQYRGICLGGTGCGGDAYYGDRSMLEYLDVEFTPSTGQAHVVVTDSSRTSGNTTTTMYHQTSGPSAFAGKRAIKTTARKVKVGARTIDLNGDAIWPYETAAPAGPSLAGADIGSVTVTRPSSSILRLTIGVSDLTVTALNNALAGSGGREMLIGARFATADDVFWAGVTYSNDHGLAPGAGHLENGILVDTYTPDPKIHATFKVVQSSLQIDVPISELSTVPQVPKGGTATARKAVGPRSMLYSVTGISFSSPTTIDDLNVAKHWIDIVPAFTLLG